MNRLEQRLDTLPGCSLGLLEALIGPLKKLALGRFEQLAAHFTELRRKRLLRGTRFGHPRVKTRRLSLHPCPINAQGIPFSNDAFKINNCLTEIGLMHIALRLERRRAPSTDKPANQASRQQNDDTYQENHIRLHFGNVTRTASDVKRKSTLRALFAIRRPACAFL